jgi:hypothetical protein
MIIDIQVNDAYANKQEAKERAEKRAKKGKPDSTVFKMTLSKGSASEFHHFMIDMNDECEDEVSDGMTWKQFGEWVDKHSKTNNTYTSVRFQCEVKGNEEYLSALAGELDYHSGNGYPETRKWASLASKIENILREAKKCS